MTFYLRDENTGFVLPHGIDSVTLTPVLSGSGTGISNAFEVTAKRADAAVTPERDEDMMTRGDTSDAYHASFAVGGYMPSVQHAVPLRRPGQQELVTTHQPLPQSVPVTAIHHHLLTSASLGGNLTSFGSSTGRRSGTWQATVATTANSRIHYPHNIAF